MLETERDHDTLLLQPGRLRGSETTLHLVHPLVPSDLATGPLHWLAVQPRTLPSPLATNSFLIFSELRSASCKMLLQTPMLNQTLATNPYNTQNLSLVKLVTVVI